MKQFIEAYKKEDRFPYAILLFYFLFFAGVLGSVFFEDIMINDLVLTGLILGACFFYLFYLFKALKHDFTVEKIKKDERELLHEYKVAHVGYYAMFGCAVLLTTFNALAWEVVLIIIVGVLSRLVYRVILETEE